MLEMHHKLLVVLTAVANLMTKKERAIHLRNLALKLIKARGTWVPMSGGPRLLTFDDVLSGLSICYRTPFQRVPQPPEYVKYFAALNGYARSRNLPYGLDVWWNKTVLNVEWSDDGRLDVVSYRAGQWERDLERLARIHSVR